MGRIVVVSPNNRPRIFQMDDEEVILTFEDDSGVQFGDTIRITVAAGQVYLSGSVPMNDPEVEGRIYVDGVTRSLKVSGGPTTEVAGNPFPTNSIPTSDPLQPGVVWKEPLTGILKVSLGVI